MQLADDLTTSEYGRNLQVIVEKLAASFYLVQNYCHELDQEVNKKNLS